jgi:hypothetical protein
MARIKRMGEAYSAGDVVVTIAGMQDVDPSAIEYGYSYAHEYQRGLHRSPKAWRMGAKDYEGNITLPLDVSAELEKVAPFHDIALIRPFPIVVVFFNLENERITDRLWAKFKGNKRSVSGDAAIENQFELFITDFEPNV